MKNKACLGGYIILNVQFYFYWSDKNLSSLFL